MPGADVRVLVLGGNGFTGRHLMSRLANRTISSVVAPSRTDLDLRNKKEVLVALRAIRPDVVVNLAGESSTAQDDARTIFEINAFAHLSLLEALKETGFGGRLIFASSANIYGSSADTLSRETDCPAPVNLYGCSKLLAEHFCRPYRDNFSICVTRPFNCIGVGQKDHFLVPKLAKSFKQRQSVLRLGNTAIRRDFVDIRDVARMYESVMFCEAPPAVANFATNTVHSLGEILDVFSNAAHHRPKIEIDPALARCNEILFQCGDDTVIRTLGFEREFSFEQTLQWIFENA
jgi:nucleoside-diphosphate-sugar epimerase